MGNKIEPVYTPDQKIAKMERTILLRESYQRNSVYQSVLAQNASKPMHIFIQPNQHIKSSKIYMSSEERKIAISKDKDLNKWRSAAYQKIYGVIDFLRKKNVSVTDLTPIFINERRIVYEDDCCHYNDLGRKIIAKNIVLTLSKTFNKNLSCSK